MSGGEKQPKQLPSLQAAFSREYFATEVDDKCSTRYVANAWNIDKPAEHDLVCIKPGARPACYHALTIPIPPHRKFATEFHGLLREIVNPQLYQKAPKTPSSTQKAKAVQLTRFSYYPRLWEQSQTSCTSFSCTASPRSIASSYDVPVLPAVIASEEDSSTRFVLREWNPPSREKSYNYVTDPSLATLINPITCRPAERLHSANAQPLTSQVFTLPIREVNSSKFSIVQRPSSRLSDAGKEDIKEELPDANKNEIHHNTLIPSKNAFMTLDSKKKASDSLAEGADTHLNLGNGPSSVRNRYCTRFSIHDNAQRNTEFGAFCELDEVAPWETFPTRQLYGFTGVNFIHPKGLSKRVARSRQCLVQNEQNLTKTVAPINNVPLYNLSYSTQNCFNSDKILYRMPAFPLFSPVMTITPATSVPAYVETNMNSKSYQAEQKSSKTIFEDSAKTTPQFADLKGEFSGLQKGSIQPPFHALLKQPALGFFAEFLETLSFLDRKQNKNDHHEMEFPTAVNEADMRDLSLLTLGGEFASRKLRDAFLKKSLILKKVKIEAAAEAKKMRMEASKKFEKMTSGINYKQEEFNAKLDQQLENDLCAVAEAQSRIVDAVSFVCAQVTKFSLNCGEPALKKFGKASQLANYRKKMDPAATIPSRFSSAIDTLEINHEGKVVARSTSALSGATQYTCHGSYWLKAKQCWIDQKHGAGSNT